MADTESVRTGDRRDDGPPTIVTDRFTPSEVDLFMFCASTWNTHRIHYDREFARAEGYRDLVVPGPLQAARLAQMLADFATSRGGRLDSLSVRHRSTVYCNDVLEMRATAAGVAAADGDIAVSVTVGVTDPDGNAVTAGSAVLRFPGEAADANWIRDIGRDAA